MFVSICPCNLIVTTTCICRPYILLKKDGNSVPRAPVPFRGHSEYDRTSESHLLVFWFPLPHRSNSSAILLMMMTDVKEYVHYNGWTNSYTNKIYGIIIIKFIFLQMDKQILVRNATCLSIGMSVTAHCTFAISMCVFESTLTISGPHSFGGVVPHIGETRS